MLRATQVHFPAPRRAELVEVDLPPVGPDDLLLQTCVSLVSAGTERRCFTGEFPERSHWTAWVSYPFVPGYACVGRVLEAGSAVSGIAPGDRVAVHRPHRSHHVVRSTSAHRVPGDLADADAVWFALGAIAQHAVRRGRLEAGADVAVAGAGAVGLLAAKYARVFGAGSVRVLGRRPVRDPWSDGTVFDHGDAAALRDSVRGAVPDGVDVLVDATGDPAALASLSPVVRRGGTVVLVGDPVAPSTQALGDDVLRRELSVVGAHDAGIPRAGRRWSYDRNVALTFRLLADGRLRVDDLPCVAVDAAGLPSAYADLAAGDLRGATPLVRWS